MATGDGTGATPPGEDRTGRAWRALRGACDAATTVVGVVVALLGAADGLALMTGGHAETGEVLGCLGLIVGGVALVALGMRSRATG